MKTPISLSIFLLLAAVPGGAGAQTRASHSLFNGTDLSGWSSTGNWAVQDGAITLTGQGGDITYTAETMPDDFELAFEWKIARGGNSGVLYRPGLVEYQILDNDGEPDGADPLTQAGALYWCVPPSSDAAKPAGMWNKARIRSQGTRIEHWLNGVKVVDFDYGDPRYVTALQRLLRRGGDLYGRGGQLRLQDHGHVVQYRAIELTAL